MRVKSATTVFTCPIFKVEERQVEHEDGTEETYWMVVKLPNVGVVALTTDHNIVFISQARGNSPEGLELPAGKVLEYKPDIEEMQAQAVEELAEETGYSAKRMEYLSSQDVNTDWSERSFHYFLAWDLEPGAQKLEPGEKIKIVLMTLEEVHQKIDTKQFPQFMQDVLTAALTKFSEKGLI